MRCLNDLIGDALDCPALRTRLTAAIIAKDDAETGRIIRAGVAEALVEAGALDAMREAEREEVAAAAIFGPWAPRYTAEALAKRVQS